MSTQEYFLRNFFFFYLSLSFSLPRCYSLFKQICVYSSNAGEKTEIVSDGAYNQSTIPIIKLSTKNSQAG